MSSKNLNGLEVSKMEDFVKEIEFVRRYFEIVPLDEAIERRRTGNRARRAVAIALLDGPGDNFWAVEYLWCLGIPASLFVPTGHMRENEEADHVLEEILVPRGE